MSEGLLAAYEAAKVRAREQWHADLQAARERFDGACADAEADYENKRKGLADAAAERT